MMLKGKIDIYRSFLNSVQLLLVTSKPLRYDWHYIIGCQKHFAAQISSTNELRTEKIMVTVSIRGWLRAAKKNFGKKPDDTQIVIIGD